MPMPTPETLFTPTAVTWIIAWGIGWSLSSTLLALGGYFKGFKAGSLLVTELRREIDRLTTRIAVLEANEARHDTETARLREQLVAVRETNTLLLSEAAKGMAKEMEK